MLKAVIIHIFCLLSFTEQVPTQDSCYNFDYELSSENGLNSIYIKTIDRVDEVTFKLYDLLKGEVVSEKTIRLMGEKELVFKDIKSSNYTIYFSSPNCKRSYTLGGPLGIKVGNNH